MSEFASQAPALTNGQICLKAASFHETAREDEPIRSEP